MPWRILVRILLPEAVTFDSVETLCQEARPQLLVSGSLLRRNQQPKATVTAWCPCLRPRWHCCVASGPATATPPCCFPTAPLGSAVPTAPAARWTAAACSAPWLAWCRRSASKKKISPLRHSYAKHLIEAGVDLLQVQQILVHRSILTIARYTHLASHTADACSERLNALMNGYRIGWPSATRASASGPIAAV